MRRYPWLRWVIPLVILAVLVGVGVRQAIVIVQDPYLVQAKITESNGTNYALFVVQRNPSTQDIQKVIEIFAKNVSGPVTAEFYIDGSVATAQEAGEQPPTSGDQAQYYVGQFIRPASGPGQGWANAKGAADANKVTFQSS